MSNCSDPLSLSQVLLYSPSVSEKCEFILNSQTKITTVSFTEYSMFFFMTCALEFLFYFIALNKMSFRHRIFAILICNTITHPMVYFFFPWIFSVMKLEYKFYLLFAEVFAPAVEALFLVTIYTQRVKRAMVFMALANLFSWAVGAFL